MIGDTAVGDDEWLARFIVHKSCIRSDDTVKPIAFIPYKWVEMSVTRHLGLLESEVWEAGEMVAQKRNTALVGRADNLAVTYRNCGLSVVATPQADNPNHADVIDWPAEKDAQMMLALVIAESTRYTPNHKQ
jgi:hypothetical protein